MRPRRSVNVAALVASPDEVPSRPVLRLRVIGLVVLVLFAVMVLRLWSLQVIDRRTYAAAVTANQVRMVTVPAPRGFIVDRHDTVMVGNQVRNEIVLSRVEALTHPQVIGEVAALVGKSPKAVRTALNNQQYSPYEPVPVLADASPATVQYLDTHQSAFPGVSVQQVTERYYPQGGTTAPQTLGYVGAISSAELKALKGQGYTASSQIGQSGIEAQYQKYLRGAAGKQALEVDAAGDVVGVLHQRRPTQGDTVVLNVTANLQKEVQTALTNVIMADRHSRTVTNGNIPPASNGAAVVMNAETGAILALASYPSYSLTEWIGGISTANYQALKAGCTATTGGCPLNNYAIDGLYTPGSTFKLATATAALQDGIITPSTTIKDTGVYHVKTTTCKVGVPGCTFHDATAVDAGTVNVTSALTKSDDYFFYTMGYRFFKAAAKFGPMPIQNEANAYGFGELTHIDLPGEVQGRVDSQKVREKLHQLTPKNYPNTSWYVGTNIEMAFGQGGTVLTPIEEAQAYATFADHGIKHQPEVAHAVVSPDGKVVQQIQPKVTGHVTITPTNYQAMLKGFLGVTHTPTGTAYGIFQKYSHVPANYPIAGKTGTATTTSSPTGVPNALFVGFGPTNTTHQYVVAAVVAHGGYGDAAAAPAVANIFNYLYSNPVPTSVTLPKANQQPSAAAPTSIPPIGTPTTTTTTPTTTTTTTTAPAPTTPTTSKTRTAKTAAYVGSRLARAPP